MANILSYKIHRVWTKLFGVRAEGAKAYQELHDFSKGYQESNWLFERQELLGLTAGKTVLEIGCGNGKFLKAASAKAKKIYGVDWAISPSLTNIPENAELIEGDATKVDLPPVDLVCSGDVLEHFHEKDLKKLLPKLKNISQKQYHVIACYDDKHSHLTVKDTEWWKELFESIFEQPFDSHTEIRTARKSVAVIHNCSEEIAATMR